jgi:hypothetical protein
MKEINGINVSAETIKNIRKIFEKLVAAVELASSTLEDIYLGSEDVDGELKKLSAKRISERAKYTMEQIDQLHYEVIKDSKQTEPLL